MSELLPWFMSLFSERIEVYNPTPTLASIQPWYSPTIRREEKIRGEKEMRPRDCFQQAKSGMDTTGAMILVTIQDSVDEALQALYFIRHCLYS
jgi:hypothetical protein